MVTLRSLFSAEFSRKYLEKRVSGSYKGGVISAGGLLERLCMLTKGDEHRLGRLCVKK